MLADALLDTFGPFLIPVAIFVLGVVGYGLLVWLTRQRPLARDDGRGND